MSGHIAVPRNYPCALLAASAGTGGGALYMPAYMLIFGDAHKAVPQSKATILGLAIASFVANLNRKHPNNQSPLINFSVAVLLEPATLLGALLGVVLNLVLPSSIILLILILCLAVTLRATVYKAIRLYYEEQNEPQELVILPERNLDTLKPNLKTRTPTCTQYYAHRLPLTDTNISNATLLSESLENSCETVNIYIPEFEKHNTSSLCQKLLHLNKNEEFTQEKLACQSNSFIVDASRTKKNCEYFEFYSIIYLVCNWAFNGIVLYYIGGPTTLLCGDTFHKICAWLLVPFHCICSIAYIHFLLKFVAQNENQRHVSALNGGYAWATSSQQLVLYTGCSCLAGMCAGMLGVGGGLIKGPLMLEMGLNPLSAVSTATFMILFTASSTTLSFALSGRLDPLDGTFLASVAFIAALVGIHITRTIVRKYRSQSFITFSLAITIFLSVCCMIFSFLYIHFTANTIDLKYQESVSLSQLCSMIKNNDNIII